MSTTRAIELHERSTRSCGAHHEPRLPSTAFGGVVTDVDIVVQVVKAAQNPINNPAATKAKHVTLEAILVHDVFVGVSSTTGRMSPIRTRFGRIGGRSFVNPPRGVDGMINPFTKKNNNRYPSTSWIR